MPGEYTSEQFWKLYKDLPQELKDALFAEEVGDNILNTCKRNKIPEKLDLTVEYVGRALIGLLSPDDFQEALETELGLKKAVAKRVNQEINRFIFYPVKSRLEELYRIEIAPPAQMKVTPPPQEKPPATPGKDTYRELIE